MSDYDAWRAELDSIRAQQKQLMERAGWLMERIETYPSVQPVLVAYRYGREDHDDAMAFDDEADPLRSAYRELLDQEARAECSAVGVEVGGALLKMSDLRERYPDERAYF